MSEGRRLAACYISFLGLFQSWDIVSKGLASKVRFDLSRSLQLYESSNGLHLIGSETVAWL